jgi:hypothetical protein
MTASMTDDEFVAHVKANGFDTDAEEQRLTNILMDRREKLHADPEFRASFIKLLDDAQQADTEK